MSASLFDAPNGNGEHGHSCEVWAEKAAHAARIAGDHALAAHQSVGALVREVSALRVMVETGFARMDGKVRKQQQSLNDLQEAVQDDPADNTQIRTLKGQLRAINKRKEFWAKFAATAAAGGLAVAIGAGLLRWLHW